MDKTILSIDVDWVITWEQYRDLVNLVSPMIMNRKFNKVMFGSSHSDISTLINSYPGQISIVNIDHHHDYEYVGCGEKETECLYCNWLGYYHTKDKIINPVWIANPSSNPDTRASFSILEGVMEKIEFDLTNLSNYTFDSLFICQSPAHIMNNPAAYATYETLKLVWKLGEKNG